ncbi:hypothetical protein GPALN_014151 [Globodera pallida]|nr:hypothetical protein GPALN_014151 [Globodera pallida]
MIQFNCYKMQYFFNLLIFFNILNCAKADVFTAMVDLENLLTSEAVTTSGLLEQYIQSEKIRLEQLSNLAEEYARTITEQKQQRTFADNEETLVSNPVSAYLLIKRLAREWKNIKNLMNANQGELFISNITGERMHNSIKYPDNEDLEGAAQGLLRLQDTYLLKSGDLANGYVGGEYVGTGLSAHDCFEVGRAAYNQKNYFYTLEWMQEALERRPSDELEVEILEYLAFALYQQGNPSRALAVTRRLVYMAPNHPRAAGNLKWYKEQMSAEEFDDQNELPELQNEYKRYKDIPERDSYESLCRGEFEIPPENVTRLNCYYKKDKPFLMLAPHKVEIVRFEPLVVIFRGVISDAEIAVIKELATPKLRRATVHDPSTGELVFASYRISKSAWLKDEEHDVVARINKRIHDMTNLNLATAEELQVANYGIGGHYDPHYDFSRREEKNQFDRRGNRVATVLFYMSQPKRGGFTVYTDLKMGVAPSMHDALFWYNLHRDGNGDLRTRHAACPVLTGVKWVSNKWIHDRGQEFIRPCPLKKEKNEEFVGDVRPF